MRLNRFNILQEMWGIFRLIYWGCIILWFLDMASLAICLFIPPPDNSFSRFIFYVNLGYAKVVILFMQCLAVTIAVVSITRRSISILELLVFSLLCLVLLIFVPNWRT